MGRARLLGLIAWTVLLRAQGFAPDEMRTRSGPYVPPPPPDVLRTQVNLVEVPVVVRDGKQRAIAGLKQSDFEVFDAGKKQTITAFSIEASTPAAATATTAQSAPNVTPAPAAGNPQHPPRYVALCFDNLSTKFDELKRTKDAALRFVRTGLAPGDLVAVVTTAFSQTMSFTSDPARLAESIGKVTPQLRISDDESQCPRITPYQAYVINNHLDPETFAGVVAEDIACKHLQPSSAAEDVNALARMVWEHARANSANTLYSIQSIVDGLGKMPGRRLLLLASSGFLSGDLEYEQDALIHRAVRAEVVINALDAKGLYAYDPGGRPIDAPSPRGKSMRTAIAEQHIQGRQAQAKDDGMAVLAIGTGGAFYHNNNDLDRGFHQLGVIPEAVYVLGFSPTDATPDGRYHSLKVKLAAGNHYAVQARLGYTAATKTPPAAQRAPSKLDAQAIGSDALSEIPADVIPEFGATFIAVVHVDTSKLKFEKRAGRDAQKLAIIATLLDTNGNFVTGIQGELELTLKPDTVERIAASGLNLRFPLSAPPGKYTLRAVVQEALEGKMGTASRPVELR